MDALQAIADGRSGLHILDKAISAESISHAASQQGYRFWHIDGSAIKDKAALLAALRSKLLFPAHTGNNWDALLDMLRDLSWLPAKGHVLLLTGMESLAQHNRADYDTALAVLRDAAQFWAERKHNQLPIITIIAQK